MRVLPSPASKPAASRLASSFLAVSLLGGAVLPAACSDNGDASTTARPDPGGPVVGAPRDGGAPEEPVPPGTTDITFAAGTTFAKRSCDVVLRYAGNASSVKVAGEFTSWEAGALSMTRAASGGFEIVVRGGAQASAALQPGGLYAYKLIVDGQWQLDPAGAYRKIVGDQMNSALRMPDCDAGPELASETLTVTRTGEATVRASVRAAVSGEPPVRLVASLDRAPVPNGSWSVDANGGVTFALKGLAKGKHTLSLRAFDEKQREAAPVDLPFWVEDEPFSYRDGILYMFVIDRFANGNKQNDAPVGLPVEYDADFHGGDLEGALAVLKSGYFEKLGARTIWLSPLNRQTSKYETGDGNKLYSAYHGYWPVRSREVEPRFGGDDALRAFVKEAHARGLRVLLDLINNQVHQDHEYVASHGDWFRKDCKCGDDANGCGWSQRPFDCLFQFYLPDINWRVTGAEKRFVDDAVFWLTEYDFDGFRVDAVKHVEANSVFNMRAEVSRRFEQGGARVFMVGETAVGKNDSGNFFGESFPNGYAWIDAYTGQNALDGQFDFPTRHNMADGLVSGQKPMNEIEGELRKAETRYRPGNFHVRFLNGHDNPRIASIAAQDAKLGCSWASGCRGDQLPPTAYSEAIVYTRLRRALTVLYTLPGVPYLYAGDEVAFGGGADPDMRRDMRFAEAELQALHMAKPGQSPAALTADQVAMRQWVRKLGATRTASRALRRGERVTLLGTDGDLWVYAYQASPKDLAIVAVNRGGAVNRTVATTGIVVSSVASFASPLGTGSLAKTAGGLALTLGAGEAAIFVAQ
jgi:glycosidase